MSAGSKDVTIAELSATGAEVTRVDLGFFHPRDGGLEGRSAPSMRSRIAGKAEMSKEEEGGGAIRAS